MNRSVPLARAALVAWAVLLAVAAAGSADDPKPANAVRRVGVFIGVQKYASPRVPKLRAPEQDAVRMAREVKHACGLDSTHVLTNEKATLDAIADVFTKKLPAETRPGDEVIVYWSGHGLQLPLGPDASPPVRLFLIPHNGDPSSVESVNRTMVADATFRDWVVKTLEGRRVVVILDTCHSGGAALARAAAAPPGDVKAVPPPVLVPRAVGKFPEHFLAGAMQNVRTPGGGLWVLASSRADQPSFELPKGTHGVMTYFLFEALATEKKGEPLTVGELAAVVQKRVPAFVQANAYPAEQNPVFDGPAQLVPLIRR